MIGHRLAGDMDECPVLEGGIDLVRGQSVLRRDDDLSVPAEHGLRGILAGQAEHRAAQDRVPKPQAVVPAVAGQELARRVERRVQAVVGRALEPCPGIAGRDIPKVDLEILARRRQSGAVRAPGDRRRAAQRNRPDNAARLHVKNHGMLAASRPDRDGDLEAVRAKRQVSYVSQARPEPAGTSGLQVVDQDFAIVMSDGDPPAVRTESGGRSRDGARFVHRDPCLDRGPRPSGHIRENGSSSGIGRPD